MKSLFSLTESAREVVSGLFEDSPNRTAREYADGLCDADVLECYGWDQAAVDEAYVFFDEAARFTEKLSDAEVEIGDRKETFAWAAEDCEIYNWAEEIGTAAAMGDKIEDKADRLIERIQNTYDARGVLCNVRF